MKKVFDTGDDEKLPPIPKFDLTVADEQQKAMAATHPTSASNRDYANAHAYIEQTKEHKVLTRIQRDYLAEAYATVGNYELAAKTTKNLEKRKEWKAAHDAVWRDDSKSCKCLPMKTVEMVEGKVTPVTHSNMFVVGEIFSHRENQMVNLVRCNSCGHGNTQTK